MVERSADAQTRAAMKLERLRYSVSHRLARALELHHLPDSDAVRAARSTLRTALMGEPDDAREPERLAYRDRALRRFEIAVGVVPGSVAQ